MKKFVTTALLGFATAACVFSFTACGSNEEISCTVTADEWKSALTSIYDCKHSVDSLSTFVDGEADGCIYHYYFDSTSKITYIYIKEDTDVADCYAWQDSESKFYVYNLREATDFKTELSEADFKEEVEMLAMSYTGNGLIYALGEGDTFGSATYDKTEKVYRGSYKFEGDKFNYSLKFENKKLVKFVGEILEDDDNDKVHMTINVEYKYDNISVTVPDSIKNLPLSGNYNH